MFPSPNAESFRHGGQNGMKEQHTGKASAKGGTTDWKRLDSLSHKEIRSAIEADPEARPTDANFWEEAEVVRSVEPDRRRRDDVPVGVHCSDDQVGSRDIGISELIPGVADLVLTVRPGPYCPRRPHRPPRAGLSGRAMERKHGVGRRTIIKALASARPEPQKKPPAGPQSWIRRGWAGRLVLVRPLRRSARTAQRGKPAALVAGQS